MGTPSYINFKDITAFSTQKISQLDFMDRLLNETKLEDLAKIPSKVLLFHGSFVFPRVFNQVLTDVNGNKVKACRYASYIEGGLSEGGLFRLTDANLLSEGNMIKEIQRTKSKKYNMMWLNLNWFANRYIAGGAACNPCKSMLMLEVTKEFYVYNFIKSIQTYQQNKNSIEEIDVDSTEPIYLVRASRGRMYFQIWSKIRSNNFLIVSKGDKTSLESKSSLVDTDGKPKNVSILHVTNKHFKSNGYNGSGIIFAQYNYILNVIKKLNMVPKDNPAIPIMGYMDIDPSETVDMSVEEWPGNPINGKVSEGCLVNNNMFTEQEYDEETDKYTKIIRRPKTRGVCPELLLLNPNSHTKCKEVFYTTKNDNTVYVSRNDRTKTNPKALPLEVITKNILSCIGGNITENNKYKLSDPVTSLRNGELPYMKLR